MRRHTLGALLAFFLDLAFSGARLRADLYCEQPIYQAGRLHNGIPVAHRFAFVNGGSDAIEIADLRSTCGCVTPKLEKRIYAPGEQGTLLLEVNTLALAQGPQSWRTRLLYRDGAAPKELELVLVGDVVTEVLVQPSALTLPADAPGVHEITVTDCRTKPLTVRAADAGSPCLRTVVGEPRREGGTSMQSVRLEVPADCPEGRHVLALHLFTDDSVYSELTVPVTVVKRPRQAVTASPGQVTFDGDKGESLPPRLVRLSALDGGAVEIERVEVDDPAVLCTWEKKPEIGTTLKVQIDPTRLNADLRTTVRVHLLKPAAETITISVLCVVR